MDVIGSRELVGANHGIINANNLLVTARATPNMSVDVAAGGAFIQASETGGMGTYHVFNDAVKNVVIAAADPTNARTDIVIARVRDAQYSGATSAWAIEVVQGTPSASPVQPATPANSLLLAAIVVDANASSIVAGKIFDGRIRIGDWQTWTPVWTSTGNTPSIGNGTLQGRYRLWGKTMHLNMRMVAGSTTVFGNLGWVFTLPPGIRASNANLMYQQLHVMAVDAGNVTYWGNGIVAPNAVDMAAYAQWDYNTYYSIAANFSPTVPFTWGVGDSLHMSGTIEIA